MDWILRDCRYKKRLIIKRNLFLLPSREKGMEDARSQVKAKKKWNKPENDMVSRMFHQCKKKKILNFVLNSCNA